jgi:hypothetical protein
LLLDILGDAPRKLDREGGAMTIPTVPVGSSSTLSPSAAEGRCWD